MGRGLIPPSPGAVLRKLARSTLVLIPLFGFHYVVFIGLSAFMNVNRVLELIWLFGDQLFASFQVSVQWWYLFSTW